MSESKSTLASRCNRKRKECSSRDSMAKVILIHVDDRPKQANLKAITLDPTKDGKTSWQFGRSPEAEVVICDVNVSRKHATITFDSDKISFFLTAHKSVNGVFLNNKVLPVDEPTLLPNECHFSLGNSHLFKWTVQVLVQPSPVLSEKKIRVEGGGESTEELSSESSPCPAKETESLESLAQMSQSDDPKVVAKFQDKLNNELSCSICSEIFISPVTLPCGHIFCKHCFQQWKKSCNQRPLDCPNCKEKVGRAKVTPNVYIQNLIDSFIQDLGSDMASAREKIVKSRKDEEEEELEKLKAAEEAKRQKRRAPRGRRRATEGPGRGPMDRFVRLDNSRTEAVDQEESDSDEDDHRYNLRGRPSSGPRPNVITLSSDTVGVGSESDTDSPETEDDDGDEDEEEEVPGVAGSYYGGYGRCYNCNRPGHWAPGCPF